MFFLVICQRFEYHCLCSHIPFAHINRYIYIYMHYTKCGHWKWIEKEEKLKTVPEEYRLQFNQPIMPLVLKPTFTFYRDLIWTLSLCYFKCLKLQYVPLNSHVWILAVIDHLGNSEGRNRIYIIFLLPVMLRPRLFSNLTLEILISLTSARKL